MIRIAIATDDGEKISNNPFIIAKMFHIYDLDEKKGTISLVDKRVNEVLSEFKSDEEIDEYVLCKNLRERILNDVNVIISSVSTRYSYIYFMSNNVQVLFVDPDTPLEAIVTYLKKVAEELSKSGSES